MSKKKIFFWIFIILEMTVGILNAYRPFYGYETLFDKICASFFILSVTISFCFLVGIIAFEEWGNE